MCDLSDHLLKYCTVLLKHSCLKDVLWKLQKRKEKLRAVCNPLDKNKKAKGEWQESCKLSVQNQLIHLQI